MNLHGLCMTTQAGSANLAADSGLSATPQHTSFSDTGLVEDGSYTLRSPGSERQLRWRKETCHDPGTTPHAFLAMIRFSLTFCKKLRPLFVVYAGFPRSGRN